MVFQVEITPTATAQIEKAYRWYRGYNAEFADRWFRGLMNAIATLLIIKLKMDFRFDPPCPP